MGSSSERKKHLKLFNSHKKDIYEAFEEYKKPIDPSLVKPSWDKFLEIGEAVSGHATNFAITWKGKPPYEEVEEKMAAYVDTLNRFLLIADGASVGAGPTLLTSIQSSVKKVLDTSFDFMKESIASFGAGPENEMYEVWNACWELEKIPSTNVAAIGRRISKIAVSAKGVLRKLNKLKAEFVAKEKRNAKYKFDFDSDSDSDDLSPDEMRVVEEAISTVSGILNLIREILRAVTAAQKILGDEDPRFVEHSEKILIECRVWELSSEELGACLYPPQETEAIKASVEKISGSVANVEAEIESLGGGGASEGFLRRSDEVKGSIERLRAELERSEEV